MNMQDFIANLRTQGRYSFTIAEIEATLQISKVAALNAIKRLKDKRQVVSPARGFYLILLPEYRSLNCLPPEMFIDDLMSYYSLPYYVGYLSAAQYYGAAHQRPQRFQVVTLKNRRTIQCGKVAIEFIANKKIDIVPTTAFNTMSGQIKVITIEALLIEIISSQQHSAGINNIAMIISEVAEKINVDKLISMITIYEELVWVQRLGYLFEFLSLNNIANKLFSLLENKNLHWIKFVPERKYQVLSRNSKWKIIVNSTVELDE